MSKNHSNSGMTRQQLLDAVKEQAQAAPIVKPEVVTTAPVATVAVGLDIRLYQGADLLQAVTASERTFSSGSRGYGLYGKAVMVEGQAVIIHLGSNIVVANYRQFGNGKWGWYGGGKVVIGGKKYQVGANLIGIGTDLTGQPAEGSKVLTQCTVNITEIGSKPVAAK